MTKLNALILRTTRIAALVDFYRALGLPLVEERHAGGTPHFACELGGVHFAIYRAQGGDEPDRLAPGATLIGFAVESLDEALARTLSLGAQVSVEPEQVPGERRVVVRDPDGRHVELSQAA